MRLFKLVLLYGFSFLYFDLASIKRKRIELFSQASIQNELGVKKEKKKRLERSYKNPKHLPRKKYRLKKLKYAGAKPKDKRYSNQKMLRRMYRNS